MLYTISEYEPIIGFMFKDEKYFIISSTFLSRDTSWTIMWVVPT